MPLIPGGPVVGVEAAEKVRILPRAPMHLSVRGLFSLERFDEACADRGLGVPPAYELTCWTGLVGLLRWPLGWAHEVRILQSAPRNPMPVAVSGFRMSLRHTMPRSPPPGAHLAEQESKPASPPTHETGPATAQPVSPKHAHRGPARRPSINSRWWRASELKTPLKIAHVGLTRGRWR